jgi:outer membrane protein OmpA-like peptidoglycan-associated protein
MDVLVAVGDSVLSKMDFTVDGAHIRGEAFRKIFEFVRDDQILVVTGDDPGQASYQSDTDTLTTQLADSPADLFNRSILVHECAHALVDMEFVKMTSKANECAAYLTQAVYLLLNTSRPTIPAGYGVVDAAIRLARQFGLDKEPGSRRYISYDEVIPLVRRLDEHPAYHAKHARISASDGISKKVPKQLHHPSPPEDLSMKFRNRETLGFRVPGDSLFAHDSYQLKPAAMQTLRSAAEHIKERITPHQKIFITGYTDSTGDPTYNKRLSRARAQAVANFFVREKLFEEKILLPGGDGADKPVAPNSSPEGRALNRRVEIEVM